MLVGQQVAPLPPPEARPSGAGQGERLKEDMPGGRPSKLTEDVLRKIAKLACLGLTDKQFAAVLDVNEATFNRWKKAPEFCKSLNEDKDAADKQVTVSLWQRANGYSHESVKIFCNKDGEVTQVPFIEHYPPDTAACIFWLKNRQGWKDRTEVEHELGPNATKLTERLTQALERTR